MVAASVICAPSEQEAHWLAGSNALNIVQRNSGRMGPLPSPEEAESYALTPEESASVNEAMRSHIVGDVATVHEGLNALVARTDANEVMLSTRTHSYDARARSFGLIAEAWGLPDA